MKQKLYIAAIIDTLVILTGAIFKVQHFPGAGILLSLGISFMVLIVLPACLISNYRDNEEVKSPVLHIITWFTCFVIFTAILFKIQHWPGASIALVIALPFPYLVFLPVYLVVTSRKTNHNINDTVLVLMLLAFNSVFSVFLSLNVAYKVISDSYNISQNYNRVELVLQGIPQGSHPILSEKIDDVLKTIDDYQTILLNSEGVTEAQWTKEPSFIQPDSRNAAYAALDNAGYMTTDNLLDKKLRDLISAIKSDPACSDLAENFVPILGLEPTPKNYFSPVPTYFHNNFLYWSVEWLDSVETNLRLLKLAL
jgi:hypothetical protein